MQSPAISYNVSRMPVDEKLIERCKSSDERAYYMLYEECYSLMKSISLRYIQDPAEVPVVMNQGFLKVLKSLSKYDTSKPFKAWVGRIVINTAIDYLRKKKRDRKYQAIDPQEFQSFQGNGQTSWNHADQNFDADELLNLLHRLPDKTAQVFNLFAIDGYSHDEIAQMLGISTGTSKWHVSKAREMLRKLLQDQILKERKTR